MDNSIGERIYRLRKLKGLSQEKLAKLTGVSRQTVHRWEADEMHPNNENLATLCNLFLVDKSYILDGNTTVIPPAAQPIDVVVTNDKKKRRVRLKIALTVILGVTFVVLSFLTVCLGFITITPNKGVVEKSTYSLDKYLFWILLCVSIINFIFEILLILNIVKKNKDCNTNVNKVSTSES